MWQYGCYLALRKCPHWLWLNYGKRDYYITNVYNHACGKRDYYVTNVYFTVIFDSLRASNYSY